MGRRGWADQREQERSRLQAIFLPENSVEYRSWQRRFLYQRLGLALQLALLTYPTFIVLRVVMAALAVTPLEPGWLIMAIASLLVLTLCLLVHRSPLGWRHPGWIFLIGSWTITLAEQIWATLRGVAFLGVFAWTLVFLVQATLIPVRWPLHLMAQLGLFAYYGVVNYWLGLSPENGDAWDWTLGLYLFWFCVICNFSVGLYENLHRAEFAARMELEAEREKSEKLLLNILPAAVAQQLKKDQRTIAENFAEASVLFADIVGFTELSAGIPPKEMVTLLNQIFSEFDYLAERYGLEKIKTIGDSYMVVGGLPLERVDHLEAIADMALSMQEAIAQFSTHKQTPIQMRIGINAGPVVAGVIGVKKFIYDLWGDTVNTASRMESQGVPGGIQVTEAVYLRLQNQYVFEKRGMIDVKGKGRMEVYLLRQKRA